MIIRDKLLNYLTYTYGDIILIKTGEGTYRYTYNFYYMSNPMVLAIDHSTKESKLSIKLSFMDDYKSIVENDEKAEKILKYLEVFYEEVDVEVIDGKLIISSEYTFNPFTLNLDIFSSKVDTLEQIGRDVNDMVSTDRFCEDWN